MSRGGYREREKGRCARDPGGPANLIWFLSLKVMFSAVTREQSSDSRKENNRGTWDGLLKGACELIVPLRPDFADFVSFMENFRFGSYFILTEFDLMLILTLE